jgi:DNA-binding transcriptional LysR family regulator
MNTLHLKYALEVERTCSITQAAENLFMGQPNLSKAIKELEDTLSFSIFERTSKGVMPTRKGMKFLKYARNVLLQIEKMEALSDDSASTDAQNFSISIPRGSYIASAFTSFVSELDQSKGINVNMQETNSMQAITNITDGQFNLGIIRYQVCYENYFLDYLADKKLCYEPIWEFEYLAVMSVKHPLAQQEKVEEQELSSYVEIVHGDNTVPYVMQSNTVKEDLPTKTSKRIYVYERCNQFDLLETIPSAYMRVSPIPEKWLNRYNLTQRRCQGSEHRFKDLLIFPKGYKLTALDKRFIDKLFEAKNEVTFLEYK